MHSDGFRFGSESYGDTFHYSPDTVLFGGLARVHGDSHISGGGGGSVPAPVTYGTAGSLQITVNFDSSVSKAPAAFVLDVKSVAQQLAASFNDNTHITINVGYGEADGHRLSGSALGESLSYLQSVNYSDLVSALKADQTTSADASALNTLPAANPNSGSYWVSTAEGKALGLIGPDTAIDGFAGFSSRSGIFDYNNADGVNAGQYDFKAVVAHEFTEVMGRMLLAGATVGGTPKSYDALDLFHYTSSGVHDFSGSTPGYFSVDNGQTNLHSFNTVSGGDPGDWASSATPDSFDAFATSGVLEPVSSADLTAMDVIGWNYTGLLIS